MCSSFNLFNLSYCFLYLKLVCEAVGRQVCVCCKYSARHIGECVFASNAVRVLLGKTTRFCPLLKTTVFFLLLKTTVFFLPLKTTGFFLLPKTKRFCPLLKTKRFCFVLKQALIASGFIASSFSWRWVKSIWVKSLFG